MSLEITPREHLANPGPEITPAANRLDTALFLVRLWQVGIVPHDDAANGGPANVETSEWHGRVQHVIRGEARTFTDWNTMVGCFEAMLAREPVEPAKEEGTQSQEN